MKRVYIFGIVGAVVAMMLIVGIIALAVIVSPVRAQIGRALTQALTRQPAALAQAQAVQVKDEKGILVAGVITDSPADKAGLVRGDILLKVDGTDVNTRADLNGILANHKTGDALQVIVQHGDSQKTVTVTLTNVPTQPQAQSTPQAGQQNNNPAPNRSRAAGVYLGILPIGAGEMRGEKSALPGMMKSGGQIVEVAAGSPAEKAGLKVGETISAVDGQQIDAQNSLSTLLASHKPTDSVKLSVQGTDGVSRDVTVTLGDNPQKAGSAYLGVSIGRGGRGFDMGPNGNSNGMPFGHPEVGPGLAGHPGALVQSVTTGSPAEKAGLKAGQLIVSLNATALSGPQALTDAITTHKPGDQVTLSVFDPQTSQSNDVKVTLGENPQKAGSAWLGISYSYIDLQQQQQGTPNPNGLPQPDTGGTQF